MKRLGVQSERSHDKLNCAAICVLATRRETRRCERESGRMASFPLALYALPPRLSLSASSSQAPGITEVLAGQSGAEGPACQSGDAGPADRSVSREVRSQLASVAIALWAEGPPQQHVEQQRVHEKDRELLRQETASWATLGLVCIDMVGKVGDKNTKYAIPSVMGPPEFHGILAGVSGSANMMPDFHGLA